MAIQRALPFTLIKLDAGGSGHSSYALLPLLTACPSHLAQYLESAFLVIKHIWIFYHNINVHSSHRTSPLAFTTDLREFGSLRLLEPVNKLQD